MIEINLVGIDEAIEKMKALNAEMEKYIRLQEKSNSRPSPSGMNYHSGINMTLNSGEMVCTPSFKPKPRNAQLEAALTAAAEKMATQLSCCKQGQRYI